jgi:hypothetical protein
MGRAVEPVPNAKGRAVEPVPNVNARAVEPVHNANASAVEPGRNVMASAVEPGPNVTARAVEPGQPATASAAGLVKKNWARSQGVRYDYWFAYQEVATKLLVVQFELFNANMRRVAEQPPAGSSVDFEFPVLPQAGMGLLCEPGMDTRTDHPAMAFDDDARSEAASLHDWFLARVEPGPLSLSPSATDLAHLEALCQTSGYIRGAPSTSTN